MNLSWLIVGGGIHGVHIAARLLGETNASANELRLVDPGDSLLSRWRTCTSTTGMSHLRSPSVHHLDVSPWSLKQFAGDRRRRPFGTFAHPYSRPALSLFNAHCNKVIDTFELADLHLQDRATVCSVDCDGILVKLASGREISTKNLVLAIGASEQPYWPDWAPRDNVRVHHIFQPGFEGWPSSRETVAVVGAGISGGQVALRLLDEGHKVHLISRHELRQHQFDSDPGWLGPKHMTSFSRERDHDRRRTLIANARHKGSVPPQIRRALRRLIANKVLGWHVGEVEAFMAEQGEFQLKLSTKETLNPDRVLLATGFASQRPGGAFVDTLVSSASLPCASCGYPVVDSGLRWHPHVYVSGPLAELELGPASRNIAGARRAGDRLVAAVQHSQFLERKAL